MTIATVPRQFVEVNQAKGTFRVARQAFVDEEIFLREKKAIFDKCWLYLGFEAEIERPGSYHVRMVGGREVIFNRDIKNNVNAFLNVCPHRGARLRVDRSGNTRVFYCY